LGLGLEGLTLPAIGLITFLWVKSPYFIEAPLVIFLLVTVVTYSLRIIHFCGLVSLVLWLATKKSLPIVIKHFPLLGHLTGGDRAWAWGGLGDVGTEGALGKAKRHITKLWGY
jgi:hypothetical protein